MRYLLVISEFGAHLESEISQALRNLSITGGSETVLSCLVFLWFFFLTLYLDVDSSVWSRNCALMHAADVWRDECRLDFILPDLPYLID